MKNENEQVFNVIKYWLRVLKVATNLHVLARLPTCPCTSMLFLRGYVSKLNYFHRWRYLTIMEALMGHVKFLKTVCVSPNWDLRIS